MGLIKILVSQTPWDSSLVLARKIFFIYWLIFWYTNNTITKFQKQDPWILGSHPIELINDISSIMELKPACVDGSTSRLCIKPTFSIASCVALFYLIHLYVKDGSMKNNETTNWITSGLPTKSYQPLYPYANGEINHGGK